MRESDGVGDAGRDAARTDGIAVVVEPDADGVIVRVVGELDMWTTPDLVAALRGLSFEGRLLLDLERVEFMDSSGIAALLHAQSDADMNGHRLVVRYTESGQVGRVIAITGLADRFDRE